MNTYNHINTFSVYYFHYFLQGSDDWLKNFCSLELIQHNLLNFVTKFATILLHRNLYDVFHKTCFIDLLSFSVVFKRSYEFLYTSQISRLLKQLRTPVRSGCHCPNNCHWHDQER